MKSYKKYSRRCIGDSDIAALVARGPGINCTPINLAEINFGEDGTYMAYIADDDAEIGAHYRKVFECDSWITIYDDNSCTFRARADHINIYRAGEFGCIVQLCGEYSINDVTGW